MHATAPTVPPAPTLLSVPVDDPADHGFVELLTAEEETRLVRLMEAGVAAEAALRGRLGAPPDARTEELQTLVEAGDQARNAFTQANVGLVWWVAAPIARSTGHGRDELAQEGMVGLLEAIQRFDPARSRFATYALPRIRMRVWDAAVTSHGGLGLSARRARRWRQVRGAAARLTVVLARKPRAEEVAEELGESVGVVRSLLAFTPPVTLPPDAPGWDEAAAGGPQPTASQVDGLAVRRLLRRLDPLDRAVVSQLFGLDGPVRSHVEVARALGRSESTIRRRERQALTLLRAGTAARLAA